MKLINFNKEESDVIIALLQERTQEYKNSIEKSASSKGENRRFLSFYLNPALSALNKVSRGIESSYTPNEKLQIKSCLEERFIDFDLGNDRLVNSTNLTIQNSKANHFRSILKKIKGENAKLYDDK